MTTKIKKGKRLISLLITVLMVACMVCVAVFPASATINEAVREDANGVLQARTFVYVSGEKLVNGNTVKYNHKNLIAIYFDNNNYDNQYYCTGTAFLINEDTALTCAHVVSEDMWSSSSFKNLMKAYRDAGFDVDIECELVLNKDVTVTSKVLSLSEQDDYAVLKLNQALGGKKALKLADSSKVTATQTIYALGFPADVDDVEFSEEWKENRAYDSEDVSISEGNVQKITVLNNTAVIQHSATTSGGNSGGPIVDDRGAVIGVHKWGTVTSNEFHWATSINEVKKVLNSLNISYTDIDAEPELETSGETSSVEETEADETIAETEPETQPATTVVDPVVPDGPNWALIIGIIAGVIILIAAAVIIIVLVIKKNNNGGSGNQPLTPPAPPAPPMPPVPPISDGAGETSVLSDGAGETTVLGGGATGFCLIRKSNNEKVIINKPEFIIGKERRRVDYCISDNNSVSRAHAKIRVRSGKCYITDLGSTNCTYVNGVKLSPNQELELKSGDKIKISDVEFEFNG